MMKRWICLLCLCLCLNGPAALAGEELNNSAPEAGVEAQAPAEEGAPGVEAPQVEEAEIPQKAEEAGSDQQVVEGTEKAGEAGNDQQVVEGTEKAGEAGNDQQVEEAGNDQKAEESGNDQKAEEAGNDQQAGEAGNDQQAGNNQQAGDSGAGEGNAASPEGTETPAGEKGGEEPPAGEKGGEETPADEGGEQTPAEPDLEHAEAWFERDGAKIAGRLEEVVPQLNGGETLNLVEKNINNPVCVKDVLLKKLANVTLRLDPEDPSKAIRVARTDPAGAESPESIDLKVLAECADDEKGELYFWIEAVRDETPEPTAEPAPVIGVKADDVEPGVWTNIAQTFTLSGIPEGKAYSYAAVVYDERIVPLSGNVFVPAEEGQYTVRFAMLDAIGDIVSASETYELWLDWTAPEKVIVTVDDEIGYTMHIQATDGLSGVADLSLDGGETWLPLKDDEIFTYTALQKTTYPQGTLLVRDAAGNCWMSPNDVTLEAVTPGPGGGGGGGGNGQGKPAPSHASGDGEEEPEYETLSLELPEEPMKQLTVGGEPMPLTLVLDAAQAAGAPVGQEQSFTARLESWCPAPPDEDAHENVLAESGKPAQDTLVLTAVSPKDLGDAFTYTWRFNGEVYRMLANSGIRYVALRVGDDIAAFPTEGFTGGTKYTELKMLGVSTRKFDYTLTMRVNLDPGYVSAMSDSDFSQSCDLSIRAEVENMAYELSGSTNSIMYFYDVYLGPEDMLDQPFGHYRAE